MMKYWLQRQIGKILYALRRRITYSTGIGGEVTAGYGELNDNEYWQYPAPNSVTDRLDEMPCPCSEESRVNCTTCQDLPVWYFDKKEARK